MQRLNFLTARDSREILRAINEQWGANCEHLLDLFCFLRSSNDKVYLASKDVATLPLQRFRIDSLGMYFGEFRESSLRLSIEGSQLVGHLAKKNIFDLDEDELRQWVAGGDIPVEESVEVPFDCGSEGFVILRYKQDFVGSGKYSPTNSLIYNFVPKNRRTKELIL